jgi:hypothetical protein
MQTNYLKNIILRVYTIMVKFSIQPVSGSEQKVIVKNMATGATYETSTDSMRRLWDMFIPNTRYYLDSDGIRTEGIHVADLDSDFEVGVKNNPYRMSAGSHRKRSHRNRRSRRR